MSLYICVIQFQGAVFGGSNNLRQNNISAIEPKPKASLLCSGVLLEARDNGVFLLEAQEGMRLIPLPFIFQRDAQFYPFPVY